MAALIAAALLWVYWAGLESYLADQHYQEHFAYLWCFVALTLWRTLKGPFRSRFGLRGKRRHVRALTHPGVAWPLVAAGLAGAFLI